MLRALRSTGGIVLVLCLQGGTSWAQYAYPRGYGGYGWGGWGASTPGGDIARGMGVYAAGVGAYNVQTAQAISINADTVMRWNEYVNASQALVNRQYYEKLALREKANAKAHEGIYKRLRDDPNAGDIARGDALNVALDELSNPKVFKTAVKAAKDPFSNDKLKDIPFFYASEAITFSIHQLTSEENWPLALRSNAFAAERKNLRQAIQKALDEERSGMRTPETIQLVKDRLTTLKSKVDKTYAENTADRRDSDSQLKALAGMCRMMQRPDINSILEGLRDYKGTTIADLLNFMHAFNLRFGAASTNRQRAIYEDLYPMLDRIRDDTLKSFASGTSNSAGGTSADHHKRPGEFFKGMEWDHFEPKAPPPPPQPKVKDNN